MNKKILLLTVIVSIAMNGCVVDRIKQRVYAKKLKEYNLHKKQTLAVKQRKVTTTNDVKVVETITKEQPKVLYTPSKPNLKVDNYKKVTKKIKSKIKSKVESKEKKVVKKSASKRVKRVHKKVAKVYKEPYSIEKHESDPELLGPQTTLDSNPLVKKESKEAKKI